MPDSRTGHPPECPADIDTASVPILGDGACSCDLEHCPNSDPLACSVHGELHRWYCRGGDR